MKEQDVKKTTKLWGGRFKEQTHKDAELFSSSLQLDKRLWAVDIQASVAHARMLGKTEILSANEAEQICKGLLEIFEEFKSGQTSVDTESEDIHSDIEKKLFQKIGPVAGKLHTARSRNDQVATDTRLYLSIEVQEIVSLLIEVQNYLVSESEKHLHHTLAGLTHMQHAQPVSLAQHLMAYFWMFERDKERLIELKKRILTLPLGSAALAGTSFPIDRHMVCQELGFIKPSENSLDAVSDRDFVVEFLSDASLILMHLSRLSEELVLWSMPEFKFVELSDKVTTGSSIMPQKKNPDMAELIRGRVGRCYADLIGTLTVLKALPLAYNRDLQEDKHYLFDGIDNTKACLNIMLLMLNEAQWKTENMKKALAGDFSNTTDLADDLVKKGLSFREAHEITGKVVNFCIEQNIALENITLNDLKKFHSLFDEHSLSILPHQSVMAARTSFGGTSPAAVKIQIESAKLKLSHREL